MDAIRAVVEEKGVKWQVLQPKSMPTGMPHEVRLCYDFMCAWMNTALDMSKRHPDTVYAVANQQATFANLVRSRRDRYNDPLTNRLIGDCWASVMSSGPGCLLLHNGDMLVLGEDIMSDALIPVRKYLDAFNADGRTEMTCHVCYEEVSYVLECPTCGFGMCDGCSHRLRSSKCPQCRSSTVM